MKTNRLVFVSLILSSLALTTACAAQEAGKHIQASEITKDDEMEQPVVPSEQKEQPKTIKKVNETEETFLKIEPKENPIIFSEILPNDKLHELKSVHTFPKVYTEVEGVLTFRGNNLRDAPSYGKVKMNPASLEKMWSFSTGSSPKWGGGAGWTGQPAIIKWDSDVREMMNLKEEFKDKEHFTEVIHASLDGKIYFFDLESGKQSRNPINIHNPIKGSVSIDPRGYPLLYTGQGIPQQGEIGFRIFSLIDGEVLHFIPGIDSDAYRPWGAFDGSALVNRETDTLVMGGENGLFYNVKLNTVFNKEEKSIKVTPEQITYRYKVNGNDYQGIENSTAVYKNLAFFADNGGSVQGVDLVTMKPIWALSGTDDTDASIVIDEEETTPFLYTGTEVDKLRGSNSHSLIRKINGVTGEVIWKKGYPAFYNESVNGGMLATPIIGKNEIKDLAIFTIARHKKMDAGLMVALNKTTGEEVWRWEMPSYTWSSPVAVYDKSGQAYLIQCDSIGTMHLLNGKTGEIINTLHLGSNIEASPAVFNDSIVVASRGGQIFRVKVK
ncbi:pyrrolo-quinoline quinone [Bacillus aerolatus]|uniref:Pyrrolo-quinoline quinone n=1 Tax=Bacillus aerolatus TaxID=2653354 RepID=A0A6I1FVX1_9BACI|nr:PQQ-binding-like beta-propeller repeat protein [Bacillus aerolatus]KAB7707111.1 pyrrolo-quinoline quinone [Bacillus aerolatus]